MEQIKLKVQKSSKIIGSFLNIVKVLMIVVIILGFILMGIFGFASDDFFMQMQKEAFGIDGVSAIIITDGSAGIDVSSLTKGDFVGLGVCIVLIGVFMTMLFGSLHRIFKDVATEYTPFNMNNAKRIKFVGIVLGLSSTVVFCVSSLLLGQDVFSFALSDLLIGAAVYCLGYVFEYGCMLQKQQDETL